MRNETAKHLFVDCHEIKQVWRGLELEHVRQRLTDCNTVDSTLQVLWQIPEKDRMLVIIMWWQWWAQHNKVREGDKPMDHTQFAARVACTAGEYQGCFYKTPSPRASASRWSPPSEDMIKFNVDGAFIEDGMQGGCGVVARDHTGEVVAARAGRVDHAADAFSTELAAVDQALDLAAELGVVRLNVEMDALLLEQDLNRRSPDYSRQAQAIEDIKVQSRLWFSSCVFSHCKREANMPAHHLARLGLARPVGDTLVADHVIPASVADCVMGNLAHNVS